MYQNDRSVIIISGLKKISNWIYLVFFYCVAIVGITATVKESYIAGFLAIPSITVLVWLYSKYVRCNKEFNYTMMWIVLQAISLVLMCIITFKLQVEPSWDWGNLLNSAYIFLKDGIIDNEIYYARYTNNQFWLTALIYLFKGVRFFVPDATFSVCKSVSMIVSVVFVEITITFLYLIARKLWGNKIALIFGTACIACLPFYLYAQFLYTDTPTIMLISITIYLYLQYAESRKQWMHSILIGVIGALILKTKIMGFILIIAILIDMILRSKDIKKTLVNIGICVLAMIVVIVPLNKLVSASIPISAEMQERYEFPPTHWIMMGLGGVGGYNGNDVYFTHIQETYDSKVDANITEIKKRLNDKGVQGVFQHILSTKASRTWGNPCLAGNDYTGRNPIIKGGKFQNIFTLSGKWHWICLAYAGIYHIMMLVGLLINGIIAVKKKNMCKGLFLRIALIGIVIFLSIWECNSRYLVIFLPVLLLVSFWGYHELQEIILKHRIKNHTQGE